MNKVVDLERVRRGQAELGRAAELGRSRGSRRARPVPVEGTTASAGSMLTVDELAGAARLAAITIRRDIRAGKLKAANGGGKSAYRISRADAEAWWRARGGGSLFEPSPQEQPGAQEATAREVEEIWEAMVSGDPKRRNAAIVTLGQAPAAVQATVMERSAQAAAAYYATPEGEAELADWRALDGEPFYDDAGDYYSDEEEAQFRAEQEAASR